MPYVQRDPTGKVVGIFANLQDGYAEEFLEDTDPALLPDPTIAILAQIDVLENPPMYMRMLRETALVCIEDLATRLAEQMTANGTPTTQADILDNQIGYQKAKALDDQIRALRAQL